MSTRSSFQTADGTELALHTWKTANPPSAVFVVYHGFLAHAQYPTVRLAAELFHAQGYAVIAADMRGHGESPGLKGYLPSASTVIRDGVDVAKYAKEQYPDSKIFLAGSSMGGTIALNVSLQTSVNGVILLAPMLGLSVDVVSRTLLSGLSYIIPDWQVIPSSSTNAEKQYKDDKLRQECEEDPYSNKTGKIHVASAACCVDLANSTQGSFDRVDIPFLLLIADEDVVVKNEGSEELFAKAPSIDKTVKHYPALHGLLCEPEPLLGEIKTDILTWIQERV